MRKAPAEEILLNPGILVQKTNAPGKSTTFILGDAADLEPYKTNANHPEARCLYHATSDDRRVGPRYRTVRT